MSILLFVKKKSRTRTQVGGCCWLTPKWMRAPTPPVFFQLLTTTRILLCVEKKRPHVCANSSRVASSLNLCRIPTGSSGNGKVREAKSPIIHRADTVPPPPTLAPGAHWSRHLQPCLQADLQGLVSCLNLAGSRSRSLIWITASHQSTRRKAAWI